MNKTGKKICYNTLLTLVFTVLTALSLEMLNKFSIIYNPMAFALTILFLLVLYLMCCLVTGSIKFSVWFVNIGFLVVYVCNFYRMTMSSLPFKPVDLFMASKLGTVLSFTPIKIETEAVASVLLIFILTFLFCRFFKMPDITIRSRMVAFSVSLAVFMCVFYSNAYSKLFDSPINQTVKESYYEKGVALGFYMAAAINSGSDVVFIDYEFVSGDGSAVKNPFIPEPLPTLPFSDNAEYSEGLMQSILSYIKENCVIEQPESDVKPNVIVIMSEAFTDPTRWPNIEFSTNPVSGLHMLQQNSPHGKIITPAFGGATCNPEYEFNTGNSFMFITNNDIPFQMYNTYISEPDTRTLAEQFKQNGYAAVALHTYSGMSIYERAEIYPLLGYDKFIAEEDLPNAKRKGKHDYISDEYMTDVIIETIEEYGEKNEPLFLYSISMQNHFSYWRGVYEEEPDVTVSPEVELTEQQIGYAETYLQGIFDADKELRRLTEYLKTIDTPTILFFFGDHQPIIGTEADRLFGADALNYIETTASPADRSLKEWYEMYTTPYLLWANYDMPDHAVNNMSAFFIGANLLEAAGLNQNLYFSFLSYMYRQYNAVWTQFFEDKNNNVYTSPTTDYKKIFELFKWVQYDALYGNKYIYGEMSAIQQ